jgi:ATP-dependent exoDNAse (exonuclease V) beta subunit
MIYGECVHLLLSEMPKYRQYFDTSFDVFAENLLNKFDVSNDIKNKAKSEAYQILVNPKFDFIFDNNSLSEVSFVNNGKEGRIDKIIFAKDYILIIDFKTGVSQEDIPMAYINQLAYYKNAVRQMFNIESAIDIKTAILWTQSAELVAVNV